MTGADAATTWAQGGLSLLAPFVAIALATLTRRVVPSLLAGALCGALVLAGGSPVDAVVELANGLVAVVWDADHLLITLFSLFVAAMVGIVEGSGGMHALIARFERYARGRRGAMTTSWLAGAMLFFDDYANCLVVGSSMGPLYDRFRVSRVKLAYIVDSTAAPVASLAVISTWVGFEVGLLQDQLGGDARAAFGLFVSALPYRFYCVLTLVFVGALALSGRDFGPMLEAERRALAAPEPEPRPLPSGAGARLAVAPLAVLVLLTFALLVRSGWTALGDEAATASWARIIGSADPYAPMFWGALAALATACAMTLTSGALRPEELGRAGLRGARAIGEALVVLYLAWTLGDLVQAAGADRFVAGLLADRIGAWALPAIAFTLAGFTAFATGSSFFTMAALIPLVVPLALTLDPAGGVVLLASCAAVLDGSVLGDHVSPISDTTILSSMGSQVGVFEHVRTQLPYALAVAAVAVLTGTLPAGFGVPSWVTLPVGALACVALIAVRGRRPEEAALGERDQAA